MRRVTRVVQHGGLIALLVVLQVQLLAQVAPPSTTGTGSAQTSFASLPLAFEPNVGQAGEGIDFLVHHGQAVTAFSGTNSTTSVGGTQVTMSLDGANSASFVGQNELPSKTNYFIGNDQSQWHSDIPNFQKLLAKDVYPGIDLTYYGTSSTLEHDFIVAPGADYRQIAFTAGEHPALDADGNLTLGAGESALTLKKPVSYQGTAAAKRTVASRFELSGDTVHIALGDGYDPSQPLTIDPALIYSTYLGGSGNDTGFAIATDPSGNAYIYGNTASANFPTASAYQASRSGAEDIFVAKLNANGTSLVYSTYLGGTGSDNTTISYEIAADASGNAYITGGTSSTDFPLASPFDATLAGTNDAFVTELGPSGSSLVFSTYLGGTAGTSESGNAIAVDGSGYVYVAGWTGAVDFPTASPYQASHAGVQDMFLTKFNPGGTSLAYSTYLGGTGSDQAESVAVDNAGNMYLVGDTLSSDFPTVSPYQGSNGGGGDVAVTKFNPSGSAILYSTYIGGGALDYADEAALDSTGNVYIVGDTASSNFPTSSPYQAANNGGGDDVFVTKLNSTGSALTFSTYLGGTGVDIGNDIALDASNNVYVTGRTSSANFPTASAYQTTYGGGANDVYVSKLSASGSSLIYSTYIGGSGSDIGRGVAVGLNGDAYVTGNTDSSNFPTANAYQAANAGSDDAFIMQLTEHSVTVTGVNDPILSFSLGTTTCNMGTFSATETQFCTHTMSAGTNATSGYVISYIPTTTLTSGPDTIDPMTSQAGSTLGVEQFGLNLVANTAAGSNTATDFGADPSGGSGMAMSGYDTAEQFKFTTTGDNIAYTSGPSLLTTFTNSFITNITTTSEAGTYSTPVTYTIVASY